MKVRYSILGVFILAAVALVGLLGIQYGPGRGSTVAAAPANVTQDQFTSVDQAQRAVPFRIRELAVPEGFRLSGVTVRTHNTISGAGTFVTLTFVSLNHDLIELQQSTSNFSISVPDQTTEPVSVDGTPGEAISGHNLAGVPIGWVRWNTQGLFFALIGTPSSGIALTTLAGSVN